MKTGPASPGGKVRGWFRRQAGWLPIAVYSAAIVWSARSLWHVLVVPLFLVTLIGGVFLLLIVVGKIEKP